MRSERLSLRRLGLFGNRALVGAVALTVALQVALVVVPFLRGVFDLEPLDAGHWLLVVATAVVYAVAVELEKWATRALRSRRRPASSGGGARPGGYASSVLGQDS
jgi:Ca2+-transporting ATPase